MPTSLEQAFAEIDRQAASARAPVSKVDSLEQFIAHHRAAARKVLVDAKAKRAWLRKVGKSNPGVTRFYGEHLDLVSRALASHRRHIARASAELRALAAVQMKEAA
jgi:crotonobetainyl-CoA:carnitine CoA-transferase CaiB-like acyl-CoA transferase